MILGAAAVLGAFAGGGKGIEGVAGVGEIGRDHWRLSIVSLQYGRCDHGWRVGFPVGPSTFAFGSAKGFGLVGVVPAVPDWVAARGRIVERPSAVSSGVAAVRRRNSKKPVRRWNTSSRNRIKPANTSHRERGTYRGWRGMDVQISARFRRSPPVVLLRAASACVRGRVGPVKPGEYGRHTGVDFG